MTRGSTGLSHFGTNPMLTGQLCFASSTPLVLRNYWKLFFVLAQSLTRLRKCSPPCYSQSRLWPCRNSPSITGEQSWPGSRSEEHTSELQSRRDFVCRLLLEKKKIESLSFYTP